MYMERLKLKKRNSGMLKDGIRLKSQIDLVLSEVRTKWTTKGLRKILERILQIKPYLI
jgi:hypothetical protein